MNNEDPYEVKIAQLDKLLQETVKMRDHYSNEADKFRAELNGVHRILDNVPNPPIRDNKDKFPEDTWKGDVYTAAERLAIWLINQS